MAEHYTAVADEGKFARDEEEARRLHHLATADPEPENDGMMTGPAHEEKHGLERAASSKALWEASGAIRTADAPSTSENASAKRASDSK